MILQQSLTQYNALAIGQHTQALNNRLFDHYCKITAIQRVKAFLFARYEDLFQTIIRVKNRISVHVRREFCTSIKRKQINHLIARLINITVTLNIHSWRDTRACARKRPQISGFELEDYLEKSFAKLSLFSLILQDQEDKSLSYFFSDEVNYSSLKFHLIYLHGQEQIHHDYKLYNAYKTFHHKEVKIEPHIGVLQNGTFVHIAGILNKFYHFQWSYSFYVDSFNLASFSRQVAITQAEKLVFSFLACLSICSISSWGKRISFRLDLLVSLAIFVIQILLVRTIYTKLKNKNSIDMYGQNKIYCADGLIFNILIKAIAQRVRTSMDYLTTNIKDANAMANSNDTLHPKNGQQDLFNLYAVLNQYHANFTQNNLSQAKSHLDELQQSIISGIGAVGNLMYWATESNNYEAEQLKNDMRDIGYLLIHLRDIAIFASNEINHINVISGKGAA